MIAYNNGHDRRPAPGKEGCRDVPALGVPDRNPHVRTLSPGISTRTALATVTLGGSLEAKMSAIAAAGFDGLELFEDDLIECPLTPRQVRQRADDLGISVDLYQPFRDLDTMNAAQFDRNLIRAERKFDIMEQLGVQTLLVCSAPTRSAVREDSMLIDQLGVAAQRAQRRGIKLAYEALAWGTHVSRFGHAWEIVRRVDHSALGICLDSFHILARGDNPAEIANIPGEKIFYVQLADAPQLTIDVLQWSRHHRCFPGQGSFDLTAFGVHLLESGYRGSWSLEIFNDVFRSAPAARIAADGHRSLLLLQERVAKAVAEPY